ncbi:MAG: DUF2087 domain-containing protein [Rubrivivax sp.]|nr:DUF2087 domain-containing protein [Rubrivivax sp.]MDH5339070.1 DUF2087 domain-containing protein [Rubrivivax sp.]
MSAIQADLAVLVCKSGVMLGGLAPPARALALAVPALALPLGTQASEAEVNALLKDALAGSAAFLDADHVELRRWLVDTDWWRRDGYGRVYERTPTEQLAPALAGLLLALQSLDLPAWVQQRRDALQRQRDARRHAWTLRQPGADGG